MSKTKATDIVDFWRDFETTQPPFIHKIDRAAAAQLLSEPIYDDFADYRNKTPLPEKTTTTIHSSLLPVPYIGNLARAKIFILMGNPGFSPHDMLERESGPLFENFRQDVIKNLHQDFSPNEDFPFFYLNPAHSWHNGFRYWESRFRDIAEQLQKERGFTSYRNALSFIANHIAVLQLVPYHSSAFPTWAKQLPSVKTMQEWAHTKLSTTDVPGIVVRKANLWKIKGSNLLIYNKNACRQARFSLKSTGGDMIYHTLSTKTGDKHER